MRTTRPRALGRTTRLAIAATALVLATAAPASAGSAPSLVLEVSADDAAIVAGQAAAFTIRIRNAGAVTLSEAWFQNELPIGIDWQARIEGGDLDDCGFASSGTPAGQTGFSLGCQLGSLEPGSPEVVVHVFGRTEPGDCRVLASTVRAVAAGAPDAVADAAVHVRCPAPASPEPSPPRGGTAGGGPGLAPSLPDTATVPSPVTIDPLLAVVGLAALAGLHRALRGRTAVPGLREARSR